jgi:hypothetical protein
MHLLVAGKAHHRPGTFHAQPPRGSEQRAKEIIIFNGTDKQSRAGMRVVFDVTRYLEGRRHMPYVLIWALYSVLEQ